MMPSMPGRFTFTTTGTIGNVCTADILTGQTRETAVHLSTDLVWGNADDVILYEATSTTAHPAGELNVAAFLLTVPELAPGGAYYLAVRTDTQGAIGEFDETNNVWWSQTADIVVPESRVVDNGDLSFAVTAGTWNPWGDGYQGDLHYHLVGTGTSTVRWGAVLPQGGWWEVEANWLALSSNATNAEYVIADLFGPTPVQVNQRLSGSQWNSLGTFAFDAGVATVDLSDKANGLVIADAVRFVYRGENTAGPSLVSAASQAATQVLATFDKPLDATTATNAANYALDHGIAVSAATLLNDTQVLLTTSRQAMAVVHTLTASAAIEDANGVASAAPTQTAYESIVDPTFIIDDGDAGFSVPSGTWSALAAGYGSDLRYHAPGTGTSAVRWSPLFGLTGRWAIDAWWQSYTTCASDATYTIHTTSGDEDAEVDQRVNGSQWNSLGIYDLATADGWVHLTDAANGYVLADALRLTYLGPSA